MSNTVKYFKQKLTRAISASESIVNNFTAMVLADMDSDEIIGWYDLSGQPNMNTSLLVETIKNTTNILDKRYAFFLHRTQNEINEPSCVIVNQDQVLSSVDGFDGVERQMNTLMINTMMYTTGQTVTIPSYITQDTIRKQIQLILLIDRRVNVTDTLAYNLTQRLEIEANKGHAGCGLAYLRITEPRTYAHLAPQFDNVGVTEINQGKSK